MKSAINLFTRLILIVSLLVPSVLFAQDAEPVPPEDIPDIDEIMQALEESMSLYEEMGLVDGSAGEDREPLLSISHEDAVWGVPFLDVVQPEIFYDMQDLPKGPNGGFLYVPGMWKSMVKTYCLNSGGFPPDSGDSFMAAPLGGQYGGIVNSILRNSSRHPDLRQNDIQALIWGLTDGMTIDEMEPDLREAASLLLTSGEIDIVNSIVIGPYGMMSMEDIQAGMEQALEMYEMMQDTGFLSDIQSVMSEGGSFRDLEAAALRLDETMDEHQESYFQPNMWSVRPDEGYFARYDPRGYSRMTVEVMIPAFFRTERDDLGRITSITSAYGRHLMIEYNEDTPPARFTGSDVIGYPFSYVRFEHREDYYSGLVLVDEWHGEGWTLRGFFEGHPVLAGPVCRCFGDVDARISWVDNHAQEVDDLCQSVLGQQLVIELGALTKAMLDLEGGDQNSPVVEFCREAWMDALLWVMSWTESARIAESKGIYGESKGFGFDEDDESGFGGQGVDTGEGQNGESDLIFDEDWGFDLSGDDLEGRLPDDWYEGEPLEFDLSGGAAAGDSGNQSIGVTNDPVDDIPVLPLPTLEESEFLQDYEDWLVENEVGDFWEGYLDGYFDGASESQGGDGDGWQDGMSEDWYWGYNRGMDDANGQFGGGE